MASTRIYIKNMVCNRCIKVVKEELEQAGYKVQDIKLGEAEIADSKALDYPLVKELLAKNGFELLEDKNVKMVEKIKTLIIDRIHHNKFQKSGKNFSEIISREIGKDYHYLSNLFSGIENITIEKYIILQKIEKVKELLIYDRMKQKKSATTLSWYI